MKIEKGKLYYNHQLERVVIAVEDIEDKSGIYSDKIAVHCPTKEDKEYILNKLYKRGSFEKMALNKNNWYFDLRNNDFCIENSAYWDNMEIVGYLIITIDQFKEFYPDVENWEEKAKQEALKSVEELASNGVKESLSTLGVKSGLIGNINPSHYSTLSIQPIDYIEANKLDFNEGNVIKYVSRYKQKNGLEDLKKARFYIDRLIEINSK